MAHIIVQDNGETVFDDTTGFSLFFVQQNNNEWGIHITYDNNSLAVSYLDELIKLAKEYKKLFKRQK